MRGEAISRDEILQPLATLAEGKRTDVGVAVLQEIVGADEGGMAFDQLAGDGLAIEPLLQVAEGRDGDRALFLAPDQQLAVDRALESRGTPGCRERRRRCRRRCANRAFARPSRSPPGRGCRPISIRRRSPSGRALRTPASSIACASMTGRNGASAALTGPLAAPLQPGEEFDIGRLQAVPDFLDLDRRPCRRSGPAPAWRAAP